MRAQTLGSAFRRGVFGVLAACALAGAAAFSSATPARAATLMVVGDVNAAPAANLPLYLNLLGSSRDVLFSRAKTSVGSIWLEYQKQSGVTVTQSAAPLTAALLATTDMLVIAPTFDTAMDYTAAELAAVKNFVFGGGKILMVAEAQASAVLANYNAVLQSLGTTIRYTGSRYPDIEKVPAPKPSAYSTGLGPFSLAKYDTLSGGRTIIQASRGPAVVYEKLGGIAPIPLPAGLPLAGTGLLALGWFARRRRRSGDFDGGPGQGR
ncbi:MAG: hypothetical protein KDA73_10875 [Rhodobacteraceae bacterium]|nr:hypothetical protein [Paracoccaceae bacterium]